MFHPHTTLHKMDKLVLVKNWLGSLQYLETLMTIKKETCNTLEGLFKTLSNKFKPQYNKTIKSLQFRKFISVMTKM